MFIHIGSKSVKYSSPLMHHDTLLRPPMFEDVHAMLGRTLYGRHAPSRLLRTIPASDSTRGQVGLKDVPATQVSPCVGCPTCSVYVRDLMVRLAPEESKYMG